MLLKLIEFYVAIVTANQVPYDFPISKRSQIVALYMKRSTSTKH